MYQIFFFISKKIVVLKTYFSDSPYRTPISNEILQLQEGGQLHILKRKWWKQRKGGGKCKVRHEIVSHYLKIVSFFKDSRASNV